MLFFRTPCSREILLLQTVDGPCALHCGCPSSDWPVSREQHKDPEVQWLTYAGCVNRTTQRSIGQPTFPRRKDASLWKADGAPVHCQAGWRVLQDHGAGSKNCCGHCRSLPTRMHYSFDYAQQVIIPATRAARTVYLRAPGGVEFWGECCEVIPQLVNYLTDGGCLRVTASTCWSAYCAIS